MHGLWSEILANLSFVAICFGIIIVVDGFDTTLVVIGSGALRFFGAYDGSAYCK